MTLTRFIYTISFAMIISVNLYGQDAVLEPGKTTESRLLKGENHFYTISLKKGEHFECSVIQKGVDVAIDVMDPSGVKIKTVDSPNGKDGPEPISVDALQTGEYQLHIYPLVEETNVADSVDLSQSDENHGGYAIKEVIKLSASNYKQKLASIQKDKDQFAHWIAINAHQIKTVEAGNGFEDLEPFKQILKNVKVVGLGESTHGTSEFFRMKHRMLEFLVKENGFVSFYIEASMTRCRYINNYVLYGKGNLDTATAIQGFVTWRVEEVRNMIEWIRQYNITVSVEKKVKFLGYDLQKNDQGWKELEDFYSKVNSEKIGHLDSLKIEFDAADVLSNNLSRRVDGAKAFKTLYQKCLALMDDIVLNEGRYQYLSSEEMYAQNLMNIKLIVQNVESFKEESDRRDFYMAQNILSLLNREKPDAKVLVWAHNDHIRKDSTSSSRSMGAYLASTLKDKYYAIGFEFYAGSFQTRNLDINNRSQNWDVVTVGLPPIESLPWYFDKIGKKQFFIDFRNTGSNRIRRFSETYNMHSFGSMYSTKWPITSLFLIKSFDGMIYIKESTAAKNFTKVTFK